MNNVHILTDEELVISRALQKMRDRYGKQEYYRHREPYYTECLRKEFTPAQKRRMRKRRNKLWRQPKDWKS